MNDLAQFIGNGLTLGLIYSLMAAGLTLIFGYMGVVNFAHGGFYMMGAYFAFTATRLYDMPFIIGALTAIIGVAAIGFIVEKTILYPLRKYETIEIPMLAMIALSIILPNLAIIIWNPIPKASSSPIPASTLDLGIAHVRAQTLFVAAAAAVTLVIAYLLISRTRLGLAMRSTFEDPKASWLMGTNVNRIYTVTFVFGSILAAIAGVLITTIFQTSPTMESMATLKAFVIVILGGMGSFPGAIVGGLLVGLVESLGAGYIDSGYKDSFGLIVLIIMLLLRPQGLFGRKTTVE